ncbi:MAG: hypothetical protein JWO69_1749 [Thermoleophilia bacterium]|jgi:prepilin-type N-terminal cleavage/methylation domain-containing protein|nr:hypothetical protein [Thermoleophilia bacterium]
MLSERGFTMIELLVAMVLSTVVFGVAALVASSLFVGTSHSNAGRVSSKRASTVLERFDRDVRYAQSPDVVDRPRAGDDLREMLLWGQSRDATGRIVRTSPDECNASAQVALRDFCQFEDITRATATELWVRSDVRNATVADDGVECVRWEIRSGALWRTVHRPRPTLDCRRIGSTSYLGAVVEDEELLPAPPTSTTGNVERRAASLGYLVSWNPGAGARTSGSIVDPTSCSTQQTDYATAPTGRQRTFIVTVTLDLAANARASHGAAGRSRYAVSASLLGRSNDDYVRAAGCAY